MSTMTKTKTKTNTKTKVAVASVANAAGGAFLMSIALFIWPVNAGETSAIRGAEDVEFLTIKFRTGPRPLNVSTLTFDITADDDADFTTVENDVAASDHLTDCTLKDSAGVVVMGPLDPDASNQVVFPDDFGIIRNTIKPLTFTCDFTSTEADSGDPDAFAVTLTAANIDATFKKSGVAVKPVAVRPKVSNAPLNNYVIKTNEGSLTATLSSSSPSGASFVPGDQEILRVNLTAGEDSGVEIDSMVFNLSTTDNDGTGWNHCGPSNLSTSDFNLYNLSTDGLSSPLSATVSLWASAGKLCSSTFAPSYVRFNLGTNEDIPAGTTYTYVLYMDSDGASEASDDSLQAGIPSESSLPASLDAISWLDEGGTSHDGSEVTNLPVTGGTMGF